MFEQINEPIEVSVTFKDNHLLPLKFVWQDREYLVRKINLTYSRWEGRNKLYLFAVSDNANYFKLQFNSENLSWTLLESYAD